MLLSVIVPVYNGEQYLEECLSSLVSQTGKSLTDSNYEIILVNDGSTDRTEQIIDSFSSRYPFVVKINKENGGVSSARNLGLSFAKGKYIAFVDADDMIEAYTYSEVMEILLNNDLDGYFFGIARGSVRGKTDSSLIKQQTTFTHPTGFRNIHGVIKNSILTENKIRFNTSISYQEDLLFSFYCMQAFKKIGVTDLPLYIYRKNVDSATSKFFQKRTDYGDLSAKEYRCYLSRIMFLKEIKSYHMEHPGNCHCVRLLSIMTAELLWFGMNSLYPSGTVLQDIKKSGLSLKDIKIKHLANTGENAFKNCILKCLKYCFRYPLAYRAFSKAFAVSFAKKKY